MSESTTDEKLQRERALAFVEALTGHDGLNEAGDPSGPTASPAALRHLEAMLGHAGVPTAYEARRATEKGPADPQNSPRVVALASYLRQIADALIGPANLSEPLPPPPAQDRLADFLGKVRTACGKNSYCSIGVDITDNGQGNVEEIWNAYDTRVSFHKASTPEEALTKLVDSLANKARKSEGEVVNAEIQPEEPAGVAAAVAAGETMGEPAAAPAETRSDIEVPF